MLLHDTLLDVWQSYEIYKGYVMRIVCPTFTGPRFLHSDDLYYINSKLLIEDYGRKKGFLFGPNFVTDSTHVTRTCRTHFCSQLWAYFYKVIESQIINIDRNFCTTCTRAYVQFLHTCNQEVSQILTI